MPEANEYNLNTGQMAADEAFLEFLLTDKKEFILSGAAGVGKTFLMNYFINTTMPSYHKTCALLGMKPKYNEVVMTATNNQAASVLSEAVKRPTSTIHSFLNLKVNNDFSTGKSFLSRTRNWMVHENKIIFIDECSMIDQDLMEMLHAGTKDCKIIYVGDHNQLPPVFEELSPIYRRNAPFYELTEPMRNNGTPALMAICQQLRETVETGEFKPIQLVPDVIIHLDDQQMQDMLAETFEFNDNPSSRILAYTNKQVIDYNLYIRELRQLPEQFTQGEHVISNTAIHNSRISLSVQEALVIDKIGVTEWVDIEKATDTKLEVINLTVSSPYKASFDIKIPADRDHFDRLLKYFKKNKNWERYYFLQENFADIRPSDASTVHKAQGSTFDSVFIDLENISRVTDPKVAARMLYVAFSRARKKVYLYGKLADRYGSVIK